LSDETLLATNREELIETVQQCYDEEVAKRGLNTAPESSAAPVDEAPAEPEPEEEDLLVVATYDDEAEAREAKETLDAAGIPARLVNDPEDMEGKQLQVMVASSDLMNALDALGLQISEEELAAQAEAAGGE